MVRTLHECFAAVLLCGAVAIASPAFAATQHKPIHHAVSVKHKAPARHKASEAQIDRQERAITAKLNRDSLTKGRSASAAVTASAAQPADEEFTQQAFLEDDE